ncbi:MAG: LytTR family DNA-binding domain-containing protein [Caulobacter sp.]
MSNLTVVAVDDEALALRRLEVAIGRMADVTWLGGARGGREAVEMVKRLKPDLLLLDIEMSSFGGFEVLSALAPDTAPLVIFVTAYDAFAVKAFEVAAVDYVLKPVELPRLAEAIERARERRSMIGSARTANQLADTLSKLRAESQAAPQSHLPTDIWAEHLRDTVRVRVDQLEWVESERDYVRLYVRDQSYMLRSTLTDFQTLLDPSIFMRVRRSALIRTERIKAIRKHGYGDWRVILVDGREVRVGKTYLQAVRDYMDGLPVGG